MRLLIRFLLLAMIVLPLSARCDQTVYLTFAGDVTLGSEENVRPHAGSFDTVAAREGYDYFFAHMRSLFEADDLTVVNLEGVLSDSRRGKNSSKAYCFRGPADMTGILLAGSIEAVNLANNHTMDYGRSGYGDTLAALDAAGIASFGTDRIFIFEQGNVRIAFLGLWAEDYLAKRDWFRTEIPRLKAEEGVDAVVFSFHAGYEYRAKHSPRQEEYAHAAIDAGADLVMMHHPHVVQGVEVYKGRSIFYSLGNFCFGGNKTVREAEALVVQAEMRFADDGTYLGQQMKLYPVHISGSQPASDYQPRLAVGDAAEQVMALVQADTDFALPDYNAASGCVLTGYLPAE